MRPRHAIGAALAGVAAAVLVACGIDTGNSGAPTTPTPEGGTQTVVRTSTVPLPSAPEDTVRVDGLAAGLAADFSERFTSETGTNVAFIRAPAEQSFADLCEGRVDVIEVSRLPTDAETAACRTQGVKLSEPLQVAADGEVIATKNEADVGGDCITVQQARDIFRAGSPYTSWSQLGFDDLPITATGRQDGSADFTFFGQVVLGVNDASLADVRADYVVGTTDQREREEVTGDRRLVAARARVDRYEQTLRNRTLRARQREVNRAVAAADRRVLAEIAAENRRRAADGTVLSAVQAARIETRNRVRSDRAKRIAQAKIDARYDGEIDDRLRRYARGVLAEAQAPGVVGGFPFAYYELFEDKLRPLEIDYGVPVTAGGQPVTMSDLTTADQRRLRALKTGTTETVPGVDVAPTQTVSGEISTVPTAQALPDVPADELPAKTKDGERIYAGPNCVFPSPVTISSGTYPFSRRTYLFSYAQALERDEVVAYVTGALTRAQALAAARRLVPISDAQLARQLAIARNGGQAPAVTPTAPTTTTRTVTTPQGTTTVQTVTTPPARTTQTTTTPQGSGIPGVSARGG